MQYNPLDPAIVSDPHRIYRELRDTEPVHWSEVAGAWVLTRYDDVVFALTDRRFSADRRRGRSSEGPRFKIEDLGPFARARIVATTDPPEHTRLRRLQGKAFTANAAERLRPHIQGIVDDLLNGLRGHDHIDFVKDFAYPLPITVIGEMLGVPLSDRDDFRRWGTDVSAGSAPAADLPPAVLRRLTQSIDEMTQYFRVLIEARRREPQDDILGTLVAAEEQGQMLSEDEVLVALIFLLIAGHETTSSLLGNGLLSLFRHPDQMSRLRQDQSLFRPAVEELLRCEGPLQATARMATEDLEIAGQSIGQGQIVITVLAAANRDPEVFVNPDDLDIGREPNPHVAFGDGIHTCMGAALARVEAQVAFATFLERFPNVTLDADPDTLEWRGSFIIRGLTSLPVVLQTNHGS